MNFIFNRTDGLKSKSILDNFGEPISPNEFGSSGYDCLLSDSKNIRTDRNVRQAGIKKYVTRAFVGRDHDSIGGIYNIVDGRW